MTFILAIAERDRALIASDTSSLVGGVLGELTDSKLRDLGRGAWGAGTGMQQWNTLALDAVAAAGVKDLPALCAAVRAVGEAPAIRDLVDGMDPEGAALMRSRQAHGVGALGGLVLCCPSIDGYRLMTITSDGQLERYPRGNPYACVPLGIRVADMRDHVYGAVIPLPRTREAAIQAVAGLFRWAATATAYVSASVELSYLTRAGAHHIPPTADLLRESITL